MLKGTARSDKALSSYDSERYALDKRQLNYLDTIRELKKQYQRGSGFAQKQVFVKMIYAFMQDLCGYPNNTYVVTTAAYGDESAESYPHALPVTYFANPTLFYFTPSDDEDDVQDLWVRHAQVYLASPTKGDAALDCATNIVCTNFFSPVVICHF